MAQVLTPQFLACHVWLVALVSSLALDLEG